MKTLSLRRIFVPKVAVLAAGLVAAFMVATVNPAPVAQAYSSNPPLSSCAGCHSGGVITPGTTATSPATTLAPGASYSVMVTPVVNPSGGMSGYSIVPVAPATGSARATGTSATYTATMTAPAAAGLYTYTVWTNQGPDGGGVVGKATYTITVAAAPVAVTTTTALVVSPATAVAPADATLTATVTGAGAVGNVDFLNNGISMGLVPVANGVATKALTGVVAGSYSYTAKFIPTDAALFTTSSTLTATAFEVTVASPMAVVTTTALGVSPATAVAPGSATLTATVTGADAAGTVEFWTGMAMTGYTSLGSGPIVAGIATKALTGLAEGNYTYTAIFTPTNAAQFTSSTSTAVAFVVTAAVPTPVTTTTTLAVSPGTAVAPANATLTASVYGAGAAGTVEFFNGTTTLGTSPVAAGVATKGLVGIVAGTFSYTAKFIPTDATAFGPSTSSAVAFVVTVAPTQSTVKILLIAPRHGVVGTRVLLAGQFFGTSGVVKFGTVTARVGFWSTNLITVTVPFGSVVGNALVRVYPTGQAVSNAVSFLVDRSYSEETDSGDLSSTGLIGTQHLGMYNDYPSNCASCHNGLNRPKAPVLTIEDANMKPGISCAACHAPGKSEADTPLFVTAMNDPAKVVYNRCSDCHSFPVRSND